MFTLRIVIALMCAGGMILAGVGQAAVNPKLTVGYGQAIEPSSPNGLLHYVQRRGGGYRVFRPAPTYRPGPTFRSAPIPRSSPSFSSRPTAPPRSGLSGASRPAPRQFAPTPSRNFSSGQIQSGNRQTLFSRQGSGRASATALQTRQSRPVLAVQPRPTFASQSGFGQRAPINTRPATMLTAQRRLFQPTTSRTALLPRRMQIAGTTRLLPISANRTASLRVAANSGIRASAQLPARRNWSRNASVAAAASCMLPGRRAGWLRLEHSTSPPVTGLVRLVSVRSDGIISDAVGATSEPAPDMVGLQFASLGCVGLGPAFNASRNTNFYEGAIRLNKPFAPFGSTGRTEPRNLREQIAMQAAKADYRGGSIAPFKLGDKRWPDATGWVKMTRNINKTEIHYVYNTRTGAIRDFKFIDKK